MPKEYQPGKQYLVLAHDDWWDADVWAVVRFDGTYFIGDTVNISQGEIKEVYLLDDVCAIIRKELA